MKIMKFTISKGIDFQHKDWKINSNVIGNILIIFISLRIKLGIPKRELEKRKTTKNWETFFFVFVVDCLLLLGLQNNYGKIVFFCIGHNNYKYLNVYFLCFFFSFYIIKLSTSEAFRRRKKKLAKTLN